MNTSPFIWDLVTSISVQNNENMMNNLQNFGIQLMTQFKACRTTEFLFSLDNRLSDTAFTIGTLTNLVT
jgi:hypothetical protein